MAKKTLSAIGTASDGIARTPSKSQKAFNALIARIEKRRAALAEWEVFGTDFQRRFNEEFTPLLGRFNAVRVELVHRLDQAYDTKGLTKVERRTIGELITHIAGKLMASIDDPAIAELHQRYRTHDPEAEAAALDDRRRMLEAVFGASIADDVDLDSPDDVMRYVHEQTHQQYEREREHQEARENYHANRKKSPKREAAEERARAEQAEVHLSIREVYRKLASALHPDREIDPVERERKAALMQRVNIAYASRSLLDLLEIQLELEHIDQAALDNISEDRLKRWNTILKEQLSDLEMELGEVELGFLIKSRMNPALVVSPKNVKRALTATINEIRETIKGFEQYVRVVDDGRGLKPWLKQMKWHLAEI
jgi:hypothetical protein